MLTGLLSPSPVGLQIYLPSVLVSLPMGVTLFGPVVFKQDQLESFFKMQMI